MIELIHWSQPAETVELPANEVHIWRARLDVSAEECARLSSCLSAGELARANRFVFPRDRDHFIVARGTLRMLLATYLQESPQRVEFQTGKYGKPSLTGTAELRFNLTHSHGLALYGFAMQRELGIDTEKMRAEFASEEIAERNFSEAEKAELRGLPPGLRTPAFFLCWTRKEAYVKAHGDGLQIPLASFDVSLTPGGPETLRSVDSQRWHMESFIPATNYVAALLVEGERPALRFWSAQPEKLKAKDWE